MSICRTGIQVCIPVTGKRGLDNFVTKLVLRSNSLPDNNDIFMCVANCPQVVHAFEEDSKRKLLKFATGSDRAPIQGLGSSGLVSVFCFFFLFQQILSGFFLFFLSVYLVSANTELR